MNKKFLQSVAVGITGLSLIASCSHFGAKKESNICGAKNGCAAAKAEEANKCAAKKDEAHKYAAKKDKKDKKAKKAKKVETVKATEEKKTN